MCVVDLIFGFNPVALTLPTCSFTQEWIKEGFTIVKGPEKSNNKENKKKAEEAKAAEESERKKYVF